MPQRGPLVTRDELYALVWAEPMLKVAERYGVSSSYLARVCTNLRIPRPHRGYWAKLAVGKAPEPKPLPPALPGDEISWTPGTTLALVMREPSAARNKAFSKVSTTRLGPKGAQEHPLIQEARANFESTEAASRNGFLKPSKRNLAHIIVTRGLMEKALSLANDLFIGLERRGHRVVLGSHSEHIQRPEFDPRESPNKQSYYDNLWSPGRQTLIYINGTPLGIILYEMTEATVMHYVKGEYIREAEYLALKPRVANHMTWKTTQDIPSGRFGLLIYTSYYDRNWSQYWKESKPGQLGKSALSLVKKIEEVQPEAERIVAEGRLRYEDAQIKWKAAQERREAEEREHRRQKSISESRDELMQLIQAFDKADRASKAIRRLTAAATNLGEVERQRFEVLITEAKSLLGVEPDIQSFLTWKPPSECN